MSVVVNTLPNSPFPCPRGRVYRPPSPSLPARLGWPVASESPQLSPFGAAGAPYRSIQLRGFTPFASSRAFLVDQSDVLVDQNDFLVDQNVVLVDQNVVLVVQNSFWSTRTTFWSDLLVMGNHLIDFLMSFRDFEELSLLFRSSGDSFCCALSF